MCEQVLADACILDDNESENEILLDDRREEEENELEDEVQSPLNTCR
jgi:hypothetical protein